MHMTEAMTVAGVLVRAMLVSGVAMASMVVPVMIVVMAAMPGRSRHHRPRL